MLGFLLSAFIGGRTGVVTLSGETIADSGAGLARASVILKTDGTVFKREGGSTSQIDSATDWIIPNAAASTAYQAKWDLISGDAPTETTSGWLENDWTAITEDMIVGYATGGVGTESGVIRVSIRYGSGAVLDTGDYDITATQTS